MTTYSIDDQILTTFAVAATEAAGLFYGTVWQRHAADPDAAGEQIFSAPADSEPHALTLADAYVTEHFPQAVHVDLARSARVAKPSDLSKSR